MQKGKHKEKNTTENKKEEEKNILYDDGFKNKRINGRIEYTGAFENMDLDKN